MIPAVPLYIARISDIHRLYSDILSSTWQHTDDTNQSFNQWTNQKLKIFYYK